jgi:hypothetical protein
MMLNQYSEVKKVKCVFVLVWPILTNTNNTFQAL